jgi:alkaline phosphatase
MEKADDCGLATGVVVTSSITHATPAAFLSHIIDRGREYEIAMQYPLRQWDLLIGGGRKFFESRVDTVTNTWTAGLLPELAELEYDLYYSYDSLAAHPPKRKFYALLEREELPPALQRNYRLEQLTNLAVNHLKARETGFVLMVEGSQIDWACHDNKVEDFFAEMKDFSEAVRAAYEFARDDGNTLVLVTADHETGGMAITGGSSDGTNLKISFISKSHTGGVVGVFAYGPGAEQFGGILENYQIGQRLLRFLPSGTLKAAQ